MLHAVIAKYSVFSDIIINHLNPTNHWCWQRHSQFPKKESFWKFKISFRMVAYLWTVNIDWCLFIFILPTVYIVFSIYVISTCVQIIYIVFISCYCWCGYTNFSCLQEIWTNWLCHNLKWFEEKNVKLFLE